MDRPTPQLDDEINKLKNTHNLITVTGKRYKTKQLNLVTVQGVTLQEQAQKALLEAQRDLAHHSNKKINVISSYRSWAKQAYLYARYKSGLSSLPAAPPGSSYHNIGIAIDITNYNDKEIRTVLHKHNWNWGSNFGDKVHFSYRVTG